MIRRAPWIAMLAAAAVCARAAPHPDARLRAAVEANRAGALELLEQIVDIDSGTGDVAGGSRVEALLTERLRGIGAEVHAEPAEAPGLPDNVVAVWHGAGRSRILLIAHIDTVFGPGTAAARPFRVEGDRALGPGVGDEKAGVVNAFTALKILHDLKYERFGTLTLLLDDSEERGSPGSRHLIERLARESQVELNMEPGDPPDALTVWRKGSSNVRIHVSGRSAHAGMAPQDGRNAAQELVHQLSRLEGVFPHAGDGITVNLTILQAGERPNIIPNAAEAVLNVRYRRDEDFRAVEAKIEAMAHETEVPDTSVTVTADVGYPPLVENPVIDSLAARAQRIYAEIGRSAALSGNGGASESALALAAGTPALDGLGWVGGDFHTDHEWVDLGSAVPRLYLLTRLLMDLSTAPPAAMHTPR